MLDKERGLYIAHCAKGALSIQGKMANRHGLIAGATGTGKTVTLQVMAETFCQAGVPCFMADMKGDLSGISQVGKMSGFIEKRLPEFGIENPEFQSCPVRFYDVFGEQGHPMRTTISQMGPQLLSRLMQLNETQDGVLNSSISRTCVRCLTGFLSMRKTTPRNMVISLLSPSEPSNVPCCSWRVRVLTSSLENHHLTSMTSCNAMPLVRV